MRNTRERRERILQMLVAQSNVQVADLVPLLGVSAVTIRTDLAALEQRGLLSRNHGGAKLLRKPPPEQDIHQKDALNVALKECIGARAAHLVQPGDNIIIDSGTTTMPLARNIRDLSQVTVMTNGLNVAWELASAEGVQLMLAGGLLRKTSLSLQGAQAEACLSAYSFDKLFLAVDGLDLKFGLTTYDEAEASLNARMVDRAKKVIVLSDSSKFGRVSLHRIANLDRVHCIVTDDGISDEYREGIQSLGIELILADLAGRCETTNTSTSR